MNAGLPSQTERLVARFLDMSLPKAEWTHEAHLRVGLWHVRNFQPEVALDRVREGIVRLNEAHGTPNTDRGGYHETITRFYLAYISGFLRAVDPDQARPLDDLASELIARDPRHDLTLRHFSRELLGTVAARRGWVEPDLLPLPFPANPDAV